eukprot:TRINITY_DN7258_c0_g1_i1.p1 TRINITY_DN7258_c0_g1~~TRINITY_DN7258_c0_g1_i1.p1  ORF type:complete len:209 (-),score=54.07 TRINITY_DN7258_c0_g1_i1:19-645(-)
MPSIQQLQRLTNMQNWFENAIQLLSKLSNLELSFNETNSQLLIKFLESNHFSYVLTLHFQPNSTKIQTIQLEPCSTIQIEDLVKEVIASNDLCFLVREIKARILLYQNIIQQLQQFKNTLNFTFIVKGQIWEILNVIIDQTINCDIMICRDFPFTDAPILLNDIKILNSKQNIINLKETINQHSMNQNINLTEFIEFLFHQLNITKIE